MSEISAAKGLERAVKSFEEWEKDDELFQIITEFDHELYRAWLGKTFNRPFTTWPKEILEVSMHKCRTAFKRVPLELRKASKEWLHKEGWASEDPGDL